MWDRIPQPGDGASAPPHQEHSLSHWPTGEPIVFFPLSSGTGLTMAMRIECRVRGGASVEPPAHNSSPPSLSAFSRLHFPPRRSLGRRPAACRLKQMLFSSSVLFLILWRPRSISGCQEPPSNRAPETMTEAYPSGEPRRAFISGSGPLQ